MPTSRQGPQFRRGARDRLIAAPYRTSSLVFRGLGVSNGYEVSSRNLRSSNGVVRVLHQLLASPASQETLPQGTSESSWDYVRRERAGLCLGVAGLRAGRDPNDKLCGTAGYFGRWFLGGVCDLGETP